MADTARQNDTDSNAGSRREGNKAVAKTTSRLMVRLHPLARGDCHRGLEVSRGLPRQQINKGEIRTCENI